MEELQQDNEELRELLQQVTERLIAAEQKIKQLTEQLGQNSRNSNWPSSRDHICKPKQYARIINSLKNIHSYPL